MKTLHVVGARPNFMKVDPVMRALSTRGVRQILVHTGQHFDANMSDIFFHQLDLREPDINLGVGADTHAQQTAQIMSRLETVVLDWKPDWVFVYGDVNSTVAAALVCAKLLIPVGHVEAGLRSFDRTMPEEINRLVTDQVADLLFTPSADGNENLIREGVDTKKIHLVGNVMIDTLVRLLPKAMARWEDRWSARWGKQRYVLVTLHRPSNVDDPAKLRELMTTLSAIGEKMRLIFPVHPRTRQRLETFEIRATGGKVHLVDPMGYLDFLALQKHAAVVITDSGGVQEETTFLDVPCVTVRENTERPITVTLGTNILVGQDRELLSREVNRILEQGGKRRQAVLLWDGRAGERIADVMGKAER